MSGKHIGKCLCILREKNFSSTYILLADTGEIKYTLVPNTKEKSDLWKHFSLHKQKTDGRINADIAVCKQCSSIVTLARGTSNMSTHVKHHHPQLLFGSPVGNKRKANTLAHISWYVHGS